MVDAYMTIISFYEHRDMMETFQDLKSKLDDPKGGVEAVELDFLDNTMYLQGDERTIKAFASTIRMPIEV